MVAIGTFTLCVYAHPLGASVALLLLPVSLYVHKRYVLVAAMTI